MKVLECYNCGASESSFYAEENGFHLVKCSRCGLLYVTNRPDDQKISQAHQQGRHTGLKALDVTGEFDERKIPVYLDRLEDIFEGDLAHIQTWLDVGCGHGEFMLSVKTYSDGTIDIRGTEPNVHKQHSARQRGLDVSYFDLSTHQDKYDVISLLNVYSHLPDPPAFLESLKKNLNPGGQLIIETGDTANLASKDHYRPFYLPDHLSFASEEIISSILGRLGFEVTAVKKYPYLNLSLNPKQIVKEVIKIILPGHESRFYYYLKWHHYAQTDMYIQAALKPEYW